MATVAYARYPTPPPTISPKDHDRRDYDHRDRDLDYRPYSPQPHIRNGESNDYYTHNHPSYSLDPSHPHPHQKLQPQWMAAHPEHDIQVQYDAESLISQRQEQQNAYSYHPALPRQHSPLISSHPQSYSEEYENQNPIHDLVAYHPQTDDIVPYHPHPQSDIPRSQDQLRHRGDIYNPSSFRSPTLLTSPRPLTPTKTRSPRRSPRPIHFSPLNPLPSPYSTSRPSPRPGLLARLLTKLENLTRRFMSWVRRNPIKAGLLTALPVLAGAAMFNVFSSAAKVMSAAGIMLMEGMGGGKLPGNWSGQIKDAVNEGRDRVQDALSEGGDNLKDARDDAKTAAEKKAAEWGYGIDDFEGIGGCKGGPIDGFVKVMQMMVNHYCKLTPSPVPRALSILLELYFLDQIKR